MDEPVGARTVCIAELITGTLLYYNMNSWMAMWWCWWWWWWLSHTSHV